MTTKEGTFLVSEADEASAVLRDVDDGQIHALSSNPDLEVGAVVDATVTAEPPMEVTWTAEVHEARTIDIEHSELEPTTRAREAASEQDVGGLTRFERAGEGEVHVLSVPEGDARDAADDVLEDVATVERAARLGAVRVEVRTAPGVVSIRYLPE